MNDLVTNMALRNILQPGSDERKKVSQIISTSAKLNSREKRENFLQDCGLGELIAEFNLEANQADLASSIINNLLRAERLSPFLRHLLDVDRLLSPEERKLLNELLGTNSDDGVGGKLLHIDLTDIDGDVIKIKYFWSETGSIINGERSLSQLPELRHNYSHPHFDENRWLQRRQRNDPVNLGQSLYNWLNLPDKVINLINQQQEIILAIALPEQLSEYDWELLHLVNKNIVPIRWFKQPRKPVSPKDRPLNVLFMAAEPEGSQSQINFEQQEIKILEGTKRYPINLVIEESGSLEGLKETRKYFFPDQQDNLNNLDILHLAADIDWKCLLTESEYGDRCESNAQEIMGCFKETFPQLIFLSSSGSMTSLPSDLIQKQANLVLTVNYQESEEIISVVYENLASGETLEKTIFEIYKKIYREKPNLSSLRLYVADTRKLSEHLVEEGQTKTRHRVKKEKFGENAEVATREDFVGRRRQLQKCLNALKNDQKVGVLIHGMGGLGKSSIAYRIITDRLPDYKPIIWSRWTKDNKKEKKEPLNENKLLGLLSTKLFEEEDLEKYLKVPSPNLLNNLSIFFNKLFQRKKLLVLIFDDFEWNLEPKENKYKIMAEPARVLKAVVEAIENSETPHKIIITCRYNEFVDDDILSSFYFQGLDSFPDSGSDLQKMLRKLENFNSQKVSQDLIKRSLDIAAGNPRLLEDLNKNVLSLPEAKLENKLTEYETNPELWKERVIWPDLYEQIDDALEKVLSSGLIYQIPVPLSAMLAVCENKQGKIDQGIHLGLIEESPDREEKILYRVSRILPRIISRIQLPQDEKELSALSGIAAKNLSELWGNKNNKSEERWREIFRLLFADKNNPQRFRQGFSQMLAVRDGSAYDDETNSSLEAELRQLQNELSEEQFCCQLEDYLRQGDWRKADEETAWLFCSVMVQEGYSNWLELWEKFPGETLNEIDQLWVDYSQGHFGFSIQKRIWEEVERDWQGHWAWEEEKWEKFGTKVGWVIDVDEQRWKDYENMPFSKESEKGNLPALIWCRDGRAREGFKDQQWWVDPMWTHMRHDDALILFSRIQT